MVAQTGGGAMGADMVNLVRRHLRAAESPLCGHAHPPCVLQIAGKRPSGVAAESAAGYLGQNVRAPPLGGRQSFEDHGGTSLGEDGRSEERRVGKECRSGWWAEE